MFFPLHDQNNEAVKTVPIISYLVIGLCLLVHLYTVILGFGASGRSNLVHFIYRHGLVPSAFFGDQTSYPIQLQNFVADEEQRKIAEKIGPGGFELFQPDMMTVKSSTLWLYLMPFTCIFLHAGWMHLITNMWFFWIFSDNVEEKMGSLQFGFFYVVVGIFSSLAHALLQSGSTVPLIGASGAVSGVMGAYLVLFPRNRITSYFCPVWFFIRRIDVPAIVVLGFYFLLNMLQMSQSDKIGANIAFDAHIFGFIAGTGLATIFKRTRQS